MHKAITALACSAALLLTSGCLNNGRVEDDEVNTMFQQLMQRPDIEQVVATYKSLLDRIGDKLIADIGIKPFKPILEEGGSACPGDASAVRDAEVRDFGLGVSKGNISDAAWPKALEIVTDLTKHEGFNEVATVIDKPGDHEVAIRDTYGAEIIFATAKNTILSMSTGCHLTLEAKERGTPAPRNPY